MHKTWCTFWRRFINSSAAIREHIRLRLRTGNGGRTAVRNFRALHTCDSFPDFPSDRHLRNGRILGLAGTRYALNCRILLCIGPIPFSDFWQHKQGCISPSELPSRTTTDRQGGPSQFLPAALRAAQACRYLIYSEADFEIFCPAGATRCTNGGEIWHGGPSSSVPNFTSISATTRV